MDFIFKKICYEGTRYTPEKSRYGTEHGTYVVCDRCKRENISEYMGLNEYTYDLCIPCVNLINQATCNKHNINCPLEKDPPNTPVNNKMGKLLTEHEQMIRDYVENKLKTDDTLTLMEQDIFESDEGVTPEFMSRMKQGMYDNNYSYDNMPGKITRMEQGIYDIGKPTYKPKITRMEQDIYDIGKPTCKPKITRMEQGIYDIGKPTCKPKYSPHVTLTRMEQSIYDKHKK